MAANATAEQLGLGIAELERVLEAEVEAWIEQARAADAAEDALSGGDDGRPAGPPASGTPAGTARKRAAGKLEALAAPAVAAAPDRPPKANTTDLASAVMPLKKGGFDQLYNLQAFAGRGQVIFAIGTHDSTTGTTALHWLPEHGAANLAAGGIAGPIGAAAFDAGYASEDNFTADCPAELYIAVTRDSVQAGKPGGAAAPSGQPGWQAMAAKLGTPEGRAIYRQRKAIIEPVFAQLFARFGRTLHYRGDMVTTEIHLWAAVHNMLKAIRARTRREQRQRQATTPAPALAAA